LWNTQRPADVQSIHRAYRQAGCDLITTNTFGASAVALDRHGLRPRAVELNRAGAAAARLACGDDAWVLGDIGPFGGFLEPLGDMAAEDLRPVFAEQAQALRAGGADAAVIETMSDPAEVAVAIAAARSIGDWPIIATYAFAKSDTGFKTMMGIDVDEAIGRAIDAGATVVGANCGTNLSLEDYARLADQLVGAARGLPVILQPNAGSPTTVDGKLVYHASAREMAALARRLVAAGVRIIGGCCGTTPAMLKEIARAAGDSIGA
ncbi:MAG TPA: homocysteine S-methyltransferase family protein, partial [Tepidisphaeraceae bacterium]